MYYLTGCQERPQAEPKSKVKSVTNNWPRQWILKSRENQWCSSFNHLFFRKTWRGRGRHQDTFWPAKSLMVFGHWGSNQLLNKFQSPIFSPLSFPHQIGQVNCTQLLPPFPLHTLKGSLRVHPPRLSHHTHTYCLMNTYCPPSGITLPVIPFSGNSSSSDSSDNTHPGPVPSLLHFPNHVPLLVLDDLSPLASTLGILYYPQPSETRTFLWLCPAVCNNPQHLSLENQTRISNGLPHMSTSPTHHLSYKNNLLFVVFQVLLFSFLTVEGILLSHLP